MFKILHVNQCHSEGLKIKSSILPVYPVTQIFFQSPPPEPSILPNKHMRIESRSAGSGVSGVLTLLTLTLPPGLPSR
jgi:hypothetical protein